jgi:hypothetical protein
LSEAPTGCRWLGTQATTAALMCGTNPSAAPSRTLCISRTTAGGRTSAQALRPRGPLDCAGERSSHERVAREAGAGVCVGSWHEAWSAIYSNGCPCCTAFVRGPFWAALAQPPVVLWASVKAGRDVGQPSSSSSSSSSSRTNGMMYHSMHPPQHYSFIRSWRTWP